MKLPYSEGTAFLLPLRNGGFARGVVARAAPEGKIVLGYFFGPRLPSPSEPSFDDLDPTKSLLCVQFGDLGLINGDWIICGQMPKWDRSRWPIPEFVRRDPIRKMAWRIRYSDTDPSRIEEESITELDSSLARDALSGYGAVEIKLTKLLE